MKIRLFYIFPLILLLISGCASEPETVSDITGITDVATDYSEELVLIQVRGAGVAPTGNGLYEQIEFQILGGTNYVPDRWLVEILNDGDEAVRSADGRGAAPEIWSWDGRNDAGDKAADGWYRARLSIWFPGMADPVTQETSRFAVDTSGPLCVLSFSEGLFSPDGDGVNDTMEIKVDVRDELSDVQSWTLYLYDSHDALIESFHSDDPASKTLVWDGMNDGELVVGSAADYRVVLEAVDSFGNAGAAEAEFFTDILVMREGDTFRIRINSITFKPYTPDFMNVSEEERTGNLEALDLLAAKLKKFPNYKITAEGHAVSVFWDNPRKAEKENREVLLPLSEERARIILEALQERGVDALAMDYVGIGANRPIVPFSDLQNRWKNRRVVFILTK